MFDQVLVPLDRSPGSERIIRPAVALAGRLGARLVLWGVVFDRDEVGAVERHLADVLRCEADGRGEVHVTYCADPAGAIIAAADARPGTLIAMTTHARGHIGEAVLGSVSYEVLRRAGSPVLFVGPRYDDTRTSFSVVAACLDGSPTAEAVLGPTADLAREAGLSLTVLRARRDPDVQVDLGAAVLDLSTQAVPGVGRGERSAAGRVDLRVDGIDLTRHAVRLGPRATTEVVVGFHPADALVAWAERTPGAILVVATDQVTESDQVAMGSVSASVVRRSTVPVLVVPAAAALV